jgi:ATP-dependent helicase/nuclease subunit A
MPNSQPDSTKRKLEPEQVAAAHTLDRHISVSAGPGAGKTLVLVERYLEILTTQDISVDQIVAITFTNRAANEMRERVREQVDEQLRASVGETRRRWMRHKRTLEGAPITTIHGFCSRLLREFPLEAEVDPQFALLDEHQSAMLLEEVVEASLTEFINRGEEDVVRLAQAVSRPELAAALIDIYRAMRGQGLSLKEIAKQTPASHATTKDYFAAAEELNQRMAELTSANKLPENAEKRRARTERKWPNLRLLLGKPATADSIADYCNAIEEFWEARPRKSGAIAQAVQAVDELLWSQDSKADQRPRGKVPQLCFDLLARDHAIKLIGLLGDIEEVLEAEKQRLGVLDFDDLQLRTLRLLQTHTESLERIRRRFRFFLVDEFQDTNGVQRDLMNKLTLAAGRNANLFIVGDRKQSIYGFRGADVDVFAEMTAAIEAAGGKAMPLRLNFRSQPPLISFFNFLFPRIFTPREDAAAGQLDQLGYVEHEPSKPMRAQQDNGPLVELLLAIVPSRAEEDEAGSADAPDPKAEQDSRERDAAQLVQRIHSLMKPGSSGNARFKYKDIALLFRAMTGVWAYESALRRAGIPYLTVQGWGFYQREEITDLIQLLRFLDNQTDELALAAVLRSPLCGISDDALLALRCAPMTDGTTERNPSKQHRRVRRLLTALKHHERIRFLSDEEHAALDRARELLDQLLRRRNRYSIADLLRFAVRSAEYTTIIAAKFDGAQRLANVEKLSRLAERFERSGAHLIRDFVRFVQEFEAMGGREGEGQIDESANAVRLMTIHQAKGLEFPVVIIPDLHRRPNSRDSWYVLDRHRGLTVKIPDMRDGMVAGRTFNDLRKRALWREEFESMRLLYVAATRAQDRLILSGAGTQKELLRDDTWLGRICQALELGEHARDSLLRFGDEVEVQLKVTAGATQPSLGSRPVGQRAEKGADEADLSQPFAKIFPLLRAIEPGPEADSRSRSEVRDQRSEVRGPATTSIHRFSVTQLTNHRRCPRQYYFDRVLHAPTGEEMAAWNDAEAPEPPANLTATLKGAVIHRFCETYARGDDLLGCLSSSFDHVVQLRQHELAERIVAIDRNKALEELSSLAENYLSSQVFERIECARIQAVAENTSARKRAADSLANIATGPGAKGGLWSELSFRLRRPLGVLSGTIDKLLISSSDGEDFLIEIIDFKTNRFTSRQRNSLERSIRTAAADYELQMQGYSLAARELLPGMKLKDVKATLHFLDPNVDLQLPADLLEYQVCSEAVDEAMREIVLAREPEQFPVRPATHCRTCNFLGICPAGQAWLRDHPA